MQDDLPSCDSQAQFRVAGPKIVVALTQLCDSSANGVCRKREAGDSVVSDLPLCLHGDFCLARKPKAVRNEEQRARQAELRQRNRDKRRPSRDDVARIVLWQVITRVHRTGKTEEWERILDGIIEQLVEQGFDERESDLVIEELVERYTSGRGGFRLKRHLDEGAGSTSDEG